MQRAVSAYARHSPWSDPGPFGARGFDTLPAQPQTLPNVVSGLVLHPGEAAFRGLGVPEAARGDGHLRTMEEMLAALLARDRRSLQIPRKLEHRLYGPCRDHALVACAILRSHKLPARLRVGFADYFAPHFFQDHWVCEYHDGKQWRLLDAELGADARDHFRISFDSADVPRTRFLVAAAAWRALRSGQAEPAQFGVAQLDLHGAWFVAASLLRDLAALTMVEAMPWDYWGPARTFSAARAVPDDWLAPLDALAKALAREPNGLAEADAIVAQFPWAAVAATAVSFPDGAPIEVALRPGA